MRDAKCCTEHAGALELGWRQQVAHHRRWFILLAQAGIAEEHRKSDEGPALMADRAEISVGDEAQRLFAAMVGMHPPADIR